MPMIGRMPRALGLPCRTRSAPNMLPWSVIASAGISIRAVSSSSSPTRAAPSSMENSVCTCRCTNDALLDIGAGPTVSRHDDGVGWPQRTEPQPAGTAWWAGRARWGRSLSLRDAPSHSPPTLGVRWGAGRAVGSPCVTAASSVEYEVEHEAQRSSPDPPMTARRCRSASLSTLRCATSLSERPRKLARTAAYQSTSPSSAAMSSRSKLGEVAVLVADQLLDLLGDFARFADQTENQVHELVGACLSRAVQRGALIVVAFHSATLGDDTPALSRSQASSPVSSQADRRSAGRARCNESATPAGRACALLSLLPQHGAAEGCLRWCVAASPYCRAGRRASRVRFAAARS